MTGVCLGKVHKWFDHKLSSQRYKLFQPIDRDIMLYHKHQHQLNNSSIYTSCDYRTSKNAAKIANEIIKPTYAHGLYEFVISTEAGGHSIGIFKNIHDDIEIYDSNFGSFIFPESIVNNIINLDTHDGKSVSKTALQVFMETFLNAYPNIYKAELILIHPGANNSHDIKVPDIKHRKHQGTYVFDILASLIDSIKVHYTSAPMYEKKIKSLKYEVITVFSNMLPLICDLNMLQQLVNYITDEVGELLFYTRHEIYDAFFKSNNSQSNTQTKFNSLWINKTIELSQAVKLTYYLCTVTSKSQQKAWQRNIKETYQECKTQIERDALLIIVKKHLKHHQDKDAIIDDITAVSYENLIGLW